MNILITLLIYIVAGVIVYYIVMAILGLAEAGPKAIKIAKIIMLVIALIVVFSLFFGGTYVDLPRLKIN